MKVSLWSFVVIGTEESSLILPKLPFTLVHGRIYKTIHLRSLVINIKLLKINGLEDKKITKVARENLRARVYSMIFINSHAKSSNIKKEMRQYQVWKWKFISVVVSSVQKISIWHEINGPYLNQKLHTFKWASRECHEKRSADCVNYLVTLIRKIEKISALTW